MKNHNFPRATQKSDRNIILTAEYNTQEEEEEEEEEEHPAS